MPSLPGEKSIVNIEISLSVELEEDVIVMP
jgi:hypothetical protein